MLLKIFGVFAVLLTLCLPISVSMGISAIVPKFFNPAFPANVAFLVRQCVGGVDSTPILALPLFVLSPASLWPAARYLIRYSTFFPISVADVPEDFPAR